MVIEGLNVHEVGGNAEYSVESISLGASSSSSTRCSRLSSRARCTRLSICATLVYKLITDELGDDVDVLRRAMVVRS